MSIALIGEDHRRSVATPRLLRLLAPPSVMMIGGNRHLKRGHRFRIRRSARAAGAVARIAHAAEREREEHGCRAPAPDRR
jgi:hypothetical protein